jgi:hypothetical protein
MSSSIDETMLRAMLKALEHAAARPRWTTTKSKSVTRTY